MTLLVSTRVLDVYVPAVGDVLIGRFEHGIRCLLDVRMTAHGLRIAAFHQLHPIEVESVRFIDSMRFVVLMELDPGEDGSDHSRRTDPDKGKEQGILIEVGHNDAAEDEKNPEYGHLPVQVEPTQDAGKAEQVDDDEALGFGPQEVLNIRLEQEVDDNE